MGFPTKPSGTARNGTRNQTGSSPATPAYLNPNSWSDNEKLRPESATAGLKHSFIDSKGYKRENVN